MTDISDVATAEPPWLVAARGQLGVDEAPGESSSPTVVAYYRDAGFPEVAHDSVAWCAAFVGAMLERSGIAGARTLRARRYLDWGNPLEKPRHGCIVILWRNRPDSEQGHVGFYVGERDGRVLLLGGNQGDSVSVAAFPKEQILGLRWPSTSVGGEFDTSDQIAAGTVVIAGEDVFEIALAHVLQMEGGWSEDPFDPGGPTNKGVTLAELARWEKLQVSAGTIAGLRQRLRTIDCTTVRRIYRVSYWQPACCGSLPPALALLHFDTAVNQGLGRAAVLLQSALSVEVDGEIGPVTIAAAADAGPDAVIAAYCDLRRDHYRSLAQFWRFGRGWLNRVEATSRAAMTLVGRPSAKPISVPSRNPEKEADPMPQSNAQTGSSQDTKWWGHSMTIWGVAITTLTTVMPLVARAFGFDLPAQVVQDFGAQLTALVQALGGFAGVLMTIIGRARASQPLNLAASPSRPPALRARDWRRE